MERPEKCTGLCVDCVTTYMPFMLPQGDAFVLRGSCSIILAREVVSTWLRGSTIALMGVRNAIVLYGQLDTVASENDAIVLYGNLETVAFVAAGSKYGGSANHARNEVAHIGGHLALFRLLALSTMIRKRCIVTAIDQVDSWKDHKSVGGFVLTAYLI